MIIVLPLLLYAVLAILSVAMVTMLMLFAFRKHSWAVRGVIFALVAAFVASGTPSGNGGAVFSHFVYYSAAYFGGWPALLVSVMSGQMVASLLGNTVVGQGYAILLAGLWGLASSRRPTAAGWKEALLGLWPALLFLVLPTLSVTARLLSASGVALCALMCWYAVWRGYRILGMMRFLDNAGYAMLIDEHHRIVFESRSLAKKEALAKGLRQALIQQRSQGLGDAGSDETEIVLTDGLERRVFLLKVSRATLPMAGWGWVALFRDVTVMKSLENQIAQFFDLSPHGFCVLRCSGEISQGNHALARIIGHDMNSLTGKHFLDFVSPTDQRELLEIWDDLKDGRVLFRHGKSRLLKPDGSQSWVSWSGVYVPAEESIHVIARDIDEQISRQEPLRLQIQQHSKQARMLQLVQEAILVYDSEQKIIYGNAAAEALYGIDVAASHGENIDTLLKTVYPDPFADIKAKLYQTGVWQGQINRTPHAGIELIIEVRLTLWWHQNEDRVKIIELSSDITGAIQDSRKRRLLAAIIESTDDGVISLAEDGTVETWNDGARRIFGYEAIEIIGRKLQEFALPHAVEELENALLAARRGGVTEDYRDILPHKIGKQVYTSAVMTGLRGFGAKAKVISVVVRDVTAERIMERENLRAERVKISGQIATGIGHELRNSLTTVRGFLQLFRTCSDFAVVKSQLDIMLSDLLAANRIVTDFLALAGSNDVERVPAILSNVVENLVPLLEAEGIRGRQTIKLVLNSTPQLMLHVSSIEQLILNLARNGLQAMSEHGELTIITEQSDGVVLLRVKDEGEGIAASIGEKIWTPFFTTREGSAGLGLTVCESIAALHDAKIAFDSTASGTTFTVIFLLERAKEAEQRCS